MSDDAPGDRLPVPPRPLGPEIDKKWRTVAGVLGLGGLGAGATAVFTTDVEAGPVALLIVGLIFVFIAMGGRLPSRLKMGENEAEWQAVQEYVRETVEEAPPDEKPQELQRLSELAVVAPHAAGPALEAAAYEEFAFATIWRAAGKLGFLLRDNRAERGWDFTIEKTDDGKRIFIPVVIKWLNPFAHTIVKRSSIRKVVQDLPDALRPLLVVVNELPHRPLFQAEADTHVVKLSSSDDIPELESVIARLMSREPEGE